MSVCTAVEYDTRSEWNVGTRADEPCVPVLHVINGEHYSGAERVQDLLAIRLPEQGFQVGFACIKPARFPRMRQAVDAPLVELPMRGRFDLSVVPRLASLVRRGGYALIHAHSPRAALVGHAAAKLAGVPFIYHVHSPTARDSMVGWRNRLNNMAERWALRSAERIVTVSRSLARHMENEGHDPARIVTVPNGVPCIERRVGSAPRPGQVWRLGTVALFRPRKGLETLIDAMGVLHARGIDVELNAVGPFESPEYERTVKNHAAKRGVSNQIQWIGFTRDIAAEFGRMDLFVLPSLFGEGLPMVVLEAMAAGVPVVGTDVEGVPEAVRDGLDGAIARAGDAISLAENIVRIIDGELDWESLSASAVTRQAGLFSDHAMAAGVAAAYRQTLRLVAPASVSAA